jgi:hypothetical protein
MAYLFTQPNLTSGIDQAIVGTAQTVPLFPIMILVFVFFMIFIGGYSNQKKKTGWGDFWMWANLASLATLMIAVIFTLTAGIINLTTLGIVIAISITCFVIFVLTRGRGEQ